MNNLTILALCAALAACGDCAETVVSPAAVVEVVTPAPTPTPTPTPAPVVAVSSTPEPITVCPQSNGCAPSPTPARPHPVVITPEPKPICVRDTSIALVLVDGFLTDNCGNKYGTTV